MMQSARIAALIPAAGQGLRLGRGPKAYLSLGEKSLLGHCVDAFAGHVDEIVVAVSADMLPQARAHVPEPHVVITGGESRQGTVEKLLAATSADYVLIHDAARPFLPLRVLQEVIQAVMQTGAVTVALSVADTLVQVQDDGGVNAVDRDALRAIQTPQAFTRDLITRAHQHAYAHGLTATDDAALVRQLGHTVTMVTGSSWLKKITTPDDLTQARALERSWNHER